MKFAEAERWIERVDPAVTRDRSVTAHREFLKARSTEGPLTNDAAAQVADAVQAQLSSRQAAQGKWKRLVDPGRRTTTGDMRRGGRRKQEHSPDQGVDAT